MFELRKAKQRYLNCIRKSLGWMLQREPIHGVWLNTKMDSVTLEDFTSSDGAAGPDYVYGWIQGRGLEALVVLAKYFERLDPDFGARLDLWGERLYVALDALQAKDGHIYFCYGPDMRPVSWKLDTVHAQRTAEGIWTYSDAFAAKGLIAAAARYDPSRLPEHLRYLEMIVQSIRQKQFIMNEKLPLCETTLEAQPDDYGPRMILLGACGLLEDLGHADKAGYGREFLNHIISNHHDSKTGLLCDVPSMAAANPGHAIELVGFTMQCQSLHADFKSDKRLAEILINSFEAGFIEPGIALSVSVDNQEVLNPHCPWWSLPETICAASQLYSHCQDQRILDIWQRADEAFFNSYWREEAGVAYQNRCGAAPVSDVPATPDLDPGYHTCLSLLTSMEAVERAGLIQPELSL